MHPRSLKTYKYLQFLARNSLPRDRLKPTVWVNLPPCGFQTFFPNGWEFLINSHTYYAFLSTLDYKFLFNYLQLWRSYAILSETTHRFFLHFTRTLTSKFAYWANDVTVDVMSYPVCFADIIKASDLGWIATDNDQQSYQRLSQTSKRVRFGRWWTFWAYYVN